MSDSLEETFDPHHRLTLLNRDRVKFFCRVGLGASWLPFGMLPLSVVLVLG